MQIKASDNNENISSASCSLACWKPAFIAVFLFHFIVWCPNRGDRASGVIFTITVDAGIVGMKALQYYEYSRGIKAWRVKQPTWLIVRIRPEREAFHNVSATCGGPRTHKGIINISLFYFILRRYLLRPHRNVIADWLSATISVTMTRVARIGPF